MKTPITGTPTKPQEFIHIYESARSTKIRGLMAHDINQISKEVAILDLGCGIGLASYALYANGYRNLYCLEYMRELIIYARKTLPAAHLVQADAQSIPFMSEAFNCVICYDLLEHVLKPEDVLGEAYRILKKGGVLYVSAANGYSLYDFAFRLAGKIIRGRSSHIQKFNRQGVINLLESKGFRIQDIEVTNVDFSILTLSIAAKIPFMDLLRKLLVKTLSKHIIQSWEFKVVKP